eukprot:Skav227296  [mRNA]  locus=scaffold2645:50191:51324:- [translate_table: standard]
MYGSTAKMPKLAPWKCRPCKRMIKGHQETCPVCYGHWTAVSETSTPVQDAGWTWHRWQEAQEYQEYPKKNRKGTGRGTGKDRSATNSQKPKANKEGKAKGKGDKGDGRKGDVSAPSTGLPSFPPPFVNQSYTPFSLPSTGPGGNAAFSPWNTEYRQDKVAEIGPQDSELLQAIRKSFPNQDQMPDEIRDAVLKTKAQVGKHLTSEMHRAAAASGKARKTVSQMQESQRNHRLRWMQHVAESIDSWKSQLSAFQVQQQQFQASIAQAMKDMHAARAQIESLNQQAAGAIEMPKEVNEMLLAEEEKEYQDANEIQMRSKMQELLQTCLNSTVKISTPAVASEEDDVASQARENKARTRSVSPVPEAMSVEKSAGVESGS